jgi:hypothetical protein
MRIDKVNRLANVVYWAGALLTLLIVLGGNGITSLLIAPLVIFAGWSARYVMIGKMRLW